MEIKILEEHGYESAMFGLSLSYNRPVCEMSGVAKKLLGVGGSHLKFLESMQIWLDIIAPRYWWVEADTYRVGVTKQSESTLHTITKRHLTQNDFETNITYATLHTLNFLIDLYNEKKKIGDGEEVEKIFRQIKSELPEGFLQRRIVNTNYKVLKHIIEQRKNHRLNEWRKFCAYLQKNCKYKEFLV